MKTTSIEAQRFLACPTPDAWLENALAHLPTLLIDHANCEKKAAGTALGLLYRYVDKPSLLQKLSRLAREELRHFEQVLELMVGQGVDYIHLSPSRYASSLHQLTSREEPQRLVDSLLVGAIIEARSCERFLRLSEVAPAPLSGFYARLLDSEARHFRDYLNLAERYADTPLTPRLERFLAAETALITNPDSEFRFHSGPLPQTKKVNK
ncbi:MAG: tRNA-(ms[2]io[6]A)-hydroxylase [Gammaproteobacteria bacterium]|nr:tRNA-(ms[2]io[6]A)-hydroxylase [Gammaproteobacteria bacterium]MYE51625.1 tRNA-(ms[2]io[6]A)-hydroxylase [Gammaproteobacteria bacterium]MYK28301.1 tRNA-(ms[2]io[6]A)-hydroxylase [Gammaproteobacteria bacterium]